MGTYQSKFTGAEIDGLLEEVRNGGVGGGASETVLWEGEITTTGTVVELSQSIENFDYILVESGYKNQSGAYRYRAVSPTRVNTVKAKGYNESTEYQCDSFAGTNNTFTNVVYYITANNKIKFSMNVSSNSYIAFASKVIGIKLGGGGSSSGAKKVTLWEGELKTDGATATLIDSVENYDSILVEASVIFESKRYAITTNLIDVSTIANVKDHAFNIWNAVTTAHYYRLTFGFVDNTTFSLGKATVTSTQWSQPQINKITGIKY
jgi:hypothetical protein